MATTRKERRTGIAPCASCSHRWGRHEGGIGRCAEAGCSCASFDDGTKARERARREDADRKHQAEVDRRARLTPGERAAEDAEMRRLWERVERILGADWQRRFRAPTPRRDEGIEPAAALRELGLGLDATASDVARAFRRRAMETHPDHGGDPEAFKRLVRVRDAALAALEEA